MFVCYVFFCRCKRCMTWSWSISVQWQICRWCGKRQLENTNMNMTVTKRWTRGQAPGSIVSERWKWRRPVVSLMSGWKIVLASATVFYQGKVINCCLCFSRVGRISDRNGQRETLYWWLPATWRAGKVHGDLQGTQGQISSELSWIVLIP